MENKDKEHISEKFREYYSKNLSAPNAINEREFGFGWEGKIDYRHKSFSSFQEFKAFVLETVPLYMSYSIAYYDFPDRRPVEKKGYKGAELVFDIDVNEEHEGHNPILCPVCLAKAKNMALRLIEEFLIKDFGFSRREINVNFSGSKGYHIHVENEKIRELSKEQRALMSDYISGKGAGDFLLQHGKSFSGPTATSKGWKKRIFNEVLKFFSSANLSDFRKYKIQKKIAEYIIENRQKIMENLKRGEWDVFKGAKFWGAYLPLVIKKIAVDIDKPVTFDLSRLIRVPNSLHGGSSLVARITANLDEFDPLVDAVGFSSGNFIKVHALKNISLSLLNRTFELKKGEEKSIPEAAAMVLLCKNVATLKL